MSQVSITDISLCTVSYLVIVLSNFWKSKSDALPVLWVTLAALLIQVLRSLS